MFLCLAVNEDDFIADYTGEKLKCKNANDKVKTRFYFLCDSNGTWVNDKTGAHGGSRAPQPLVSFDDQKCQVSHFFVTLLSIEVQVQVTTNNKLITNSTNSSHNMILTLIC